MPFNPYRPFLRGRPCNTHRTLTVEQFLPYPPTPHVSLLEQVVELFLLVWLMQSWLLFPYVQAQTPVTDETVALVPESEMKPTFERDKRTLLRIKKSLLADEAVTEGALANWEEDTDPCIDRWWHIGCTCNVSPSGGDEFGRYCGDYDAASTNESRVIHLDLEGGEDADEKWRGRLSPHFGRLDALRYLDLGDNEFEGEIPKTFRNLKELRFLGLSKNNLNGSIPKFFRDYTKLIRAELSENQFTGRVPRMACEANNDVGEVRVVLTKNQGLCGNLPRCMERIVFDLTDTFLINRSDSESVRRSGMCDSTPPDCVPGKNCDLILPKFWTDPYCISFERMFFKDDESGIDRYEIRIVRVAPNGGNLTTDGLSTHSIHITDPDLKLNKNSRRAAYGCQVGDDSDRDLFTYNLEPNLQELLDGASYNVTVTVINEAGPPKAINITAGPVVVDTTAPEKQEIFNTPDKTSQADQELDMELGASWNETFQDPETNVTHMTVGIFPSPPAESEDSDVDVESIRLWVVPINTTFWVVDKDELDLKKQRRYHYRVTVRNGANLSSTFESAPFTLKADDSNFLRDAIYVCVAIGVFVLGASCAGLFCYYHSPRRQRLRFDPEEHLKNFLLEIVDSTTEDARTPSDPVIDQRELAFVITDEEGSTAQSQENEAAFQELRRIHDMLIRDTYEEYSGYEIHSEGDSFQLAFTSVASAVRFCVEVQQKFLEFKWSPEVLRLPSCSVIKEGSGRGVTFRGPRVRMGIHWARKNLIVNRVHSFTKHRIFEGPAFETAKELSDIACGGQILMSHDAWTNFNNDFPKAGFPTIELLGSAKLETCPESMLIYNVTQRVGKRLIRSFPYLRKLTYVRSDVGIQIIPPPTPDMQGMLTFVVLRINPVPSDRNGILTEITFNLIARHAQYFAGYIFQEDNDEGIVAIIVFGIQLNAVRFAFAIQMALVLHSWPFEVTAVCGPPVRGSSDVPLFQGPRVVAAIHTTHAFGVSIVETDGTNSHRTSQYAGQGVNFARRLAAVAHGGQIVLASQTWTTVQNSLPPRSQSISLGRHVIDDEDDQPMWLFELMPYDLKERDFPRLKTKEKIELGYRDAPSTENEIAIVFAKAEKPSIIRRLEERRSTPDLTEREIHEILAVYYQSVSMFSSVVRHRLGSYSGYECKEPETGKFTLVFSSLKNAILWACHVHAELLELSWPERLLTLEECKPEVFSNKLVHRGIKVKIGMAYGKAKDKHPLKTGRADYFGQLPNLAARVSALARPGQVLIHVSSGLNACGVKWINDDAGILQYEKPLQKDRDGAEEVAVEVSKLGMFLLRGFNELKMLYQAQPASVSISKRFGEYDVASMYSASPGQKMPMSRFWNTFRLRNPLRYLPEPSSSFLSYTTQRHGLSSASYSPSVQRRSPSPPFRDRKLTGSNATLNSSGNNGRSSEAAAAAAAAAAARQMKHMKTEKVDEDEDEEQNQQQQQQRHAVNLMDRPMPGISPMSPFCIDAGQEPTQNLSGPSSSLHDQQPSAGSGVDQWTEITPINKTESGRSDDVIVSIGNNDSPFIVVPPSIVGRASEDDTSPADYGNQVASLYSHGAGAERSASDFSFCRQKSGSREWP